MSHSPEYTRYLQSPEWRAKSNYALAFTGNRCIIFPWLRARHCHHMSYRNFKHEQIWRDTVPLSRTAHSLVHNYFLWKTALRPAVNCYLRLMLPVVAFVGAILPIKVKRVRRA